MTGFSVRLHMLAVSALQALVDGFHDRERGQDLIEYAMLAGLIALALLGAGFFFKNAVLDLATGIGNCIDFNNKTTCSPGF